MLTTIFGSWERRLWHCRAWAGAGRLLAIVALLQAVAINPTMAQPSAAAAYRVAPGDKIGVLVVGQPDVSAESTIDRNGNLRLPIIGDIHAADMTLTELERSVARSLEKGYVKHAVVSARVVEFRPIYVVGMVRISGLYPYREGLTVLAAIARAGGIGAAGGRGDFLLAEERVRLLEINRVALLARRARLMAQLKGSNRIDFPDMSGFVADPARVAQIRESEQQVFEAERQARQQEIDVLEKQFPQLNAAIASLKQQQTLELKQRELNQQLIADYEKLAQSGLARKPTYIEVKREEARIDANIERLKSETLRAQLSIGELKFKMAELNNVYERRVMTELRETDRSLLEMSVTAPVAQLTRAARAQQLGLSTAEPGDQPIITVTRSEGAKIVKHTVDVDFPLQPGDVVQVGSLFSPPLEPHDPQVQQQQAVDNASR